MPAEVNVNGIRDMGVVPGEGGFGLDDMLGQIKALVCVGDNPAMHARDGEKVRAALEALDCLITVDSLPTDTAKLAHVAFADVPTYGKDGTYTNADRRIDRL